MQPRPHPCFLLCCLLSRFQKMPNGSLVIHDVSVEDTGSFTCIAGNSCNIGHTSAELYVVGKTPGDKLMNFVCLLQLSTVFLRLW